jgi:beta-glucanase (GH16 family)
VKDQVQIYIDDILYNTITTANTAGSNYPFNSDFFFILNVAVGGNWPGPPDATTNFPQRMVVDYVRVFQ